MRIIKSPILILGLLAAGAVCAATNSTPRFSFPRWGPSVRAGSVYDFKTDMDEGGSFSVNRYFAELGLARMWRFDRMISVSAGFGQDDYNFGGLPSEPWGDIDNYRVGLFARWSVADRWGFFGGPSIRSYGEQGTALGDTLTAAFFGGASYQFSDRLRLGPGVGVVGQLEDNPRWFPVAVVNWSITDRLNLTTGRGLAATAGPGLSLTYQISKHWTAGVAGRYEKKRFRLNSQGPFPDGVGEDVNVPIMGNIAYNFYPGGSLGVMCSYNMSGKLSAEDVNHQLLWESDYDNAIGLGIIASFRL